jgi:hypothetical protein
MCACNGEIIGIFFARVVLKSRSFSQKVATAVGASSIPSSIRLRAGISLYESGHDGRGGAIGGHQLLFAEFGTWTEGA